MREARGMERIERRKGEVGEERRLWRTLVGIIFLMHLHDLVNAPVKPLG